MRQSIGSTFLYNMIFVFILIVFGLLTATLSYYKGYKVNTRILKAIKDNSGYNDKSRKEIERVLKGIGYTIESSGVQSTGCPEKRGNLEAKKDLSSSYLYCVYYNPHDVSKKDKENGKNYYSYSVVTYIYIDLPIIGNLKIPVYSKGERIYQFNCTSKGNQKCVRN
ncbi:MAG: hypothetical protein IKF01_04080 [Bacilli bacterium]|nr:hypothetical protein [Bacilli bacterium]